MQNNIPPSSTRSTAVNIDVVPNFDGMNSIWNDTYSNFFKLFKVPLTLITVHERYVWDKVIKKGMEMCMMRSYVSTRVINRLVDDFSEAKNTPFLTKHQTLEEAQKCIEHVPSLRYLVSTVNATRWRPKRHHSMSQFTLYGHLWESSQKFEILLNPEIHGKFLSKTGFVIFYMRVCATFLRNLVRFVEIAFAESLTKPLKTKTQLCICADLERTSACFGRWWPSFAEMPIIIMIKPSKQTNLTKVPTLHEMPS